MTVMSRTDRAAARRNWLPAAVVVAAVVSLLMSGSAFAQIARQGADPDSPLLVPPPGGYGRAAVEPREVPLPGPLGGVMIDAQGVMTSYLYARQAPDGTTDVGCVSTCEGLPAALGADCRANDEVSR
jgi:hypothetical protein